MADNELDRKSFKADVLSDKDAVDSIERGRLARERLNAAVAGGAVGTWVWELATHHFIVDEYMAKLLLLDPHLAFQSLPFKTVLQQIYVQDHKLFAPTVVDRVMSAGYVEFEYRIQQPDGTFRWLQSRCSPELDAENQLVAIRAAVVDVTARKQAEEQLRTSSMLLESSQSIAGVGGWEMDVATGDIYWTAESFRVLDTTPEEYDPAKNLDYGIFQPEARPVIARSMAAAIRHGKNFDHELGAVTLSGRPVIVQITS